MSRSESRSDKGPSPAELAAIAVAIEVAWPRTVVMADEQPKPRPWRWSGRWWTTGKPVAASRHRPAGL
ncbi:MAG: hypothetical protein NVSMB12_10960 [Acidimicrobiales bacterium]